MSELEMHELYGYLEEIMKRLDKIIEALQDIEKAVKEKS